MPEPFSLRTTIAEPLQLVAKELRPFAEKDQVFADAYNSLCNVLDSFDQRLMTRTGKGLNKDWNEIPLIESQKNN